MSRDRFCYHLGTVPGLLCVLVLAQGLPPNPQALPPSPQRMLLTHPTQEQQQYWTFLSTPAPDRRVEFSKLSRARRYALVQEYLRRRGRTLSTRSAIDAISGLIEAHVPAAFSGDVAARARLRRAEEHMRTVLPAALLRSIHELLPPGF